MSADLQFSDLAVDDGLVHMLARQGICEPFEVQREAIPACMQGRDIRCRAPTGSGKTLAFGLPLVSRCARAESKYPTALVLTPTRELAEQICTVLKPLAHEMDREVIAIYGGTSYTRQRKQLNRGVDIVVACPGRLLDLMDQGALHLGDVGMVVIDEADRMADMGFMQPVRDILDSCAQERQTILFSATLDEDVAELVRDYQTDPVTVEVGPKEVSMDGMHHLFWMMHGSMKAGFAADAIRQCGRSIVFCRTRAGVERVGDELSDEGIGVATLHGGLNQRQRDRAMNRFSAGNCVALIATDVAARGIDVQGVQTVIHYDPADNGKTYKHRSGRTARAGAEGVVISLVQKPQKRAVSKIQRDAGIRCDFTSPDLTELPDTGFEFDDFNRRQGHPRRSGERETSGRQNGQRYGSRNGQSNGQRNGGQRNGGQHENQSERRNGRSGHGDRNGGRQNGNSHRRNGGGHRRNGRHGGVPGNKRDEHHGGSRGDSHRSNDRRARHHQNSRYTDRRDGDAQREGNSGRKQRAYR